MHDVIAICQTFYIVRLICRNPCQIGAICLLDLIALGIKDCDSCARQFFTRDICLGELCLCGVVFDVVMSSKLCCLTVIFRLLKRDVPCLIRKNNTIRYCCFLQRVLTQRNIFQCEAAILVDIESAALSIGVCMNTEAVSSGTGCQHLGNITLLCDYTSISRIFDVFCCIQSELDAGQIITVNERIVNSIRLCLNGLADCQLARCTVIGNCLSDEVIIIKLHSLCSRNPACCMIPPGINLRQDILMHVFFRRRRDILVAGAINCELQTSIRIIQIACRSIRFQNEVCALGQLNRQRCSSLIIGNCLAISCYLINNERASRNLACVVSVSPECVVVRTTTCHGYIAINDLHLAILIICWVNITIRRHGVVLVIIGIKHTIVIGINNQFEGGTVQSNQLACTSIFLQDTCIVDLLIVGNRQLDRRLLVCPL